MISDIPVIWALEQGHKECRRKRSLREIKVVAAPTVPGDEPQVEAIRKALVGGKRACCKMMNSD